MVEKKVDSQESFENVKASRPHKNLEDVSIHDVIAGASRSYVPEAKYNAKLRARFKNYDKVIR